ncbi:hypothetical protein C8F01DRAFT_1255696 [Mycena amicta]|nr:hypothetical protein C8F01DRAFT_1255696 [Mycena amicta]
MFFFHVLTAALLAQTTFALAPAAYTASGQPIFVAPSGSRVQPSGRNMEVFAPNGTLIHTFENVIPNVKTKRQPTLARRQDLSVTGASTQFTATEENLLESFNTTFVVPPAPTSFESQIMFLSANVQFVDANGVPVGSVRSAIQYGGSSLQGGPFWTYAIQVEFFPNGLLQVTNGADATVVPGQRMISTIVHDPSLDAEFPGTFFYIASFENIPDSPTFGLGFQVPPPIVALQLEEEGVAQASDYPPGSFVFEQVNVNLTAGAPPISWKTSVDPSTDVQVKVDVDGSQNAQVSFVFPSA